MPFQVSPGISASELDLTAGARSVSSSDAGYAAPFQWGPAAIIQNIDSEDALVATFGKPDDTIASYWFAAQSFLAYSNLLRVVRALAAPALNATPSPKTLTGTVTSGTAPSALFTNATASFVTTGLVVGQTLLIGSTTYVVNSIVNTTAFTTTTNVAANVTANTVASYGVLVKNDVDYDTNFSAGVTGYGAWSAKWAGELGNSLKVSTCASANAFLSNPTGSIALTLGSNTVTGTTTAFTTELIVGDLIVANGVNYPVASITNSTQIILGTAALATVTLATSNWQRRWQYAPLFDRAPGTSGFASARGGADDELHIVVVDEDGAFTNVAGTVLERFAFASKASDGKDANGQASYYPLVVNRTSKYVWWLGQPTSLTTNWGTVASGHAFGAAALPETVSFVGGQTGNALLADADLQLAFDKFKFKDDVDVSLIITGPVTAAVASYVIQNICEVRADCVAFVSPTKASVVNNSGSEVASITSFRNSLPSSSFGFLGSGWKYQYDKYNDKFRWVPLNGDTAGIAARTDASNDPWFSPAGFSRGNVKNVIKLAWNPRPLDRDDLYKIGVNPIVSFPAQGVVLYGDKTLLNRPSAFDRINVRRLFIVLEKTISRLAQAQLFEFNDEFTRSQFRNIVEPFLRDVKARRGVVDYRVICDDSNNTAEVIEQNRFVGDIYVKPSRSINFIQLNFVAVRSGVSFQEVAGI